MMDGDIKLFAVSDSNESSGGGSGGGSDGGPLIASGGKLVITNKDAANPDFLPSVQITREDIKEIEFYAPEMIRGIEDAKGKIRLDFEGTSAETPGSFSVDAGFVGAFGKTTSSGNKVATIKATETGTESVVNLLAYSDGDVTWKKASLAASDYKAPKDGDWDLYVAHWSPDGDANSADSIEVAVLVERSLTTNINTAINSSMSVAGTFFDFFGMEEPEGGGANIGGGQSETVTEGVVLDKSDQTDDFVLSGSAGNNEMIGGAGADYADGGAGADTLDGGAGADIVKGGAGNDVIDGGANGAETYQDGENNTQEIPIWQWGDRAIYDGKMADYTITSTGSGTFTVEDTNTADGDDGTDTLTGIEILQFSDNEKLLVAETGSFSFTDHYTGQTISEDWAHGTDFGDIIAPTSAGRSFIEGKAGNDIIIGDPSSGGGQDHISGGAGNDFIDGAGRGTSAMPWENDNIAEYEAPSRSFKWELETANSLGLTAGITKIIYAGAGATQLDGLATALGMDISTRFVADQEYWVISDINGDAGLGTDIITNIDELYFNDANVRLSVFKDPWGGFIEGTDFADTIVGEGVSEFIEAGSGDDRVFGGAGSDDAELGRGDDFFDGGADAEDFDTEAYMTNLGGNFGDFNAEQFFGDKFAIPEDGGGGTGGTGIKIVSPGASNYPTFDPGAPAYQASWTGMFLGNEETFPMTVYNVMVDGASLPMMIIQGMSGLGIPDNTLVQVQSDGAGGYDFMPGMGPDDFSGEEDAEEFTDMAQAVGAAQVRGDTVFYDGDFDRYTVTAYDGDDASDTSSALYTIISDKFSDVDISGWTADDTVVLVQDTNTGSKSFGTDLLINAERIQFDDQEYLLSVQTDVNSWTEYRWNHDTQKEQQVTMGEANWRGTFSDDTINSSSLVVDGESSAPETDRMDGQAGDDILISGAGGDRLIGGIGNDILDGGANGSTGDSWRDSDVAEYSGSIDRFTLEKVIFEGKNLNISDDQGNGVFVVKAVTKGDNVIGQISKVGSTDVLYQVDKGETFVVVKDSLPLAYGGVGTDILLGMEKAQFGFDWEGEVEFQVKYEVNSWGGNDGEVRGQGTRFDDVIDLRAGKASDNAGGYGGFDDFNDGADIWDGDAFFTGADEAQGFDIWNWQPKSTDTALKENLTSLRDFSDANDIDFGSDVSISIYKVLDGSTERWLAYDTENQWVVEEVKETSTSGVWKIHYDGAAVDAVFTVQNDAWNWQPSESDTAVATGVNVAWDDGYVDTTMTFDIYLRGTDEYVAYDTQWEMVFDIVEGNVTDGWTFKPYQAFDTAANEVSDGIWSWAPGENDTATASVSKIVWSDGGSETFNIDGSFAIYEYETGKFLAYDTEWNFVSDAVKLVGSDWVIDMGDHAHSAEKMESSNPPAERIHNSWIEGGRGNDIIMAGQGRDEITGGAGDDFIDGGSESDFLASFVGTTALFENKQLTDPDTGRSGVYSVYQDSSGVKWAWDGNQSTPSYFKVEVNGSDVSQLQETVDADFYNDRWSSYDRAHFSGDQIRYDVSEVYLKISSGRPELTAAGAYQELSVAEYNALSSGKTDYKLVVKVVDALPAAAGGDGTDYLINVEEAQFYDGHEQLEVDSWSWAYESMVSPTDRMTDSEIAGAAVQASGITKVDHAGDHGGQRDLWGDSNTTWKVLAYSGDDTLESGVYALVQVNSDSWGSWNWHDSYVVSNGSGGWKEYSATSYEGTSRGTIKNDTITSLVRNQKDEIFGKVGDDLIASGDGTDRIMGGEGNDTIWGGTNVASNSWDYQGDIAFFSGSEARYTVVRDVLVKGTENGAVEKDSSGNIKLYSDEVLSVSAKGVVSASTDSSTLIANGTSGYHAATIVIDSLSDAAGGDGIDVLVGIEGLLFGFLSSGDHGWLPSASERGAGTYKVWTESGEKTVTTMSISYMAEDYINWDYNPNTNSWNQVQQYKVNYTGTNFDDVIAYNNETSFKSEVGSSFVIGDATKFTFKGGTGDDKFIGSADSGIKSTVLYNGEASAYTIADLGSNVFTVTHKIPDSLGGTGVDTLTNIDAIKFKYGTSDEEVVRLNMESGKQGDGRYIFGTQFNDVIDNSTGQFSGLLDSDDTFSKSGGGTDTYYAGGGTGDKLVLDGFYARYDIKYDSDAGHLTFEDTLASNLGGDGTVNIKDVEDVWMYNDVFALKLDGGDASVASKYHLWMDHTDPSIGFKEIATGASFDADGRILTASGLNLFAVSQTASEHAPVYSWEQMLGSSVGSLAAPLDMNVHVKPYLDGTTASLAPSQFGSTVATQNAGISVDVEQTSITDFSSFDGSGSSADISATKNVYEGFFQGFGNDDVMYGGAGNDRFVGGPGDDVFNGRGENQTDWWDSYNTGDTVLYSGVEARYTISGPTTDVDADNNGFTDTRGFKVDTAGDTLSYFTVTDSLSLAQGGDGTDYLINIEKIRFEDGDYHLSIRDVGNSWDTWTQLFGTSGNDNFTSYTDDSADPSAKEYNINGGAGDDLIVGGAEPSGDTYSWGDSAVYEAEEKNFDISIEELTYVADSASATDDWDGDGDVDAADTTLSGVLKTKFGGTTINKVTVQDTRADEAGGLGTDTLYGIEHIEYRSGHSGSHVDLAPRSDDWDGDEIIDYFSGTAYGDVFTSDEGRQDVQGRAGDDIIITGASGDYINPGEGNDYVNSGIGETVDANDSWASRDDVNFHSVSYARVEVEKVTLWTNDTTGRALETADGKWSLSGYSGEAAKGSDLWETFTGSIPTGYTQQSGFLVTDTLPSSEAGSIGTNLIVGVDAIGFSDEYLDVKPFEDTWSWTDWFTGEEITESFQKGTPFADIGTDSLVGGSGSDTLEGKAGNDAIFGGAGGDRLNGGKGNDILDGGANGSTGDDWRDSDRAEYNGIEARYNIYQVKVDASAIRTNKLTDNSSTTSVDESIVTIYDTGSKISGGTMDGYTVVQGALPSGVDPASLSTAYIVSDALGAALGGTGNDLLIDVETVQFQESQVDLGLRIRLDNWDGNNANGYDWVEVTGTDGADDISNWGNGVDLNGDGEITDDINADSELRGKGGDDIIFGYGGGDRINGGTGNDYIDGGADGTADAYGWARKDEAIFDGPAANYTVTQYSGTNSDFLEIVSAKFSTLDTSAWTASDSFTVVVDDLPSTMGGTGTDILRNIEFINFQDKFVALTMEEFIDYDLEGTAIRAFVDGTDGSDTIGLAPDATVAEGAYDYSGNDDLLGNDGDDTIYGGAGGDYITPGSGDDIIDGGANGVDIWSGQSMGDIVRFSSNYADYEIEDADVGGVQVITVTDTDPDGDGSAQIRNVETLEFNDMHLNIGITSHEITDWEGNAIGTSYEGSIFGDTITGTSGADYITGGKGADTLNGGSGPDRIEGGLGNDNIYGGANGLDEWGNAGEDVAIYSGNESDYTVSFYDSDGESATSYQDDGYIKVVDSRTTDGVAEGTDKLYGVEGIEFSDNFVSFYVNNSFTDLDGDGKADVGGQRGTSSAETLTGADLDEKLEGKGGNDTLLGGGGADFINGGTGADLIVGGDNAAGEMDIARFDTAMSTFTIAQDKWIAKDSSGNYETNSSGDLVTYTSSTVSAGFTAVGAYSFTSTEDGEAVVDIVAEIEGIEFSDGFARFDVEAVAEDHDFDGVADFAFIGGGLSNDILGAATIDSLASYESWADASELFAADNYIDGGYGSDTISAGAGDDTINPGDGSGNASSAYKDFIDGGAGDDTVTLLGNAADWTSASSLETDANSNDGYSKYTYTNTETNTNIVGLEVYIKNVEAIEYEDGVVASQAIQTDIDRDGDGITDERNYKGTTGDESMVATGNTVDYLDAGAGDDVMSAGNGADILINGAGSDLMFGGANTGTDEKGRALKDTAVFSGNKNSLDSDGDGEIDVAADYTVADGGIVLCTGFDASTGQCTVVSVSGTTVGEISDASLSSTVQPTIFSSVTEVYVATTASDYDRVVSGSADGTADVVAVTESDGSTAYGTGYVVDLNNDGKADTFTGSSDSSFDSDNMTLTKVHQATSFSGTANNVATLSADITADATSLTVNSVASLNASGGSIKIGSEVILYSGITVSDTANTLTGLTRGVEGTTAAVASTSANVDGGASVIVYDTHEVLDVYTVTKGSDVDTLIGIEQIEFQDEVVELTAIEETAVSFSVATGLIEITTVTGTGFADEISSSSANEIFSGGAGADTYSFGFGTGIEQITGTDQVKGFSTTEDVIEVKTSVNGTSISAAADILSRVTSTSDGALINLGTNNGVDNTILLAGVSADDLTVDNFSVVEILLL